MNRHARGLSDIRTMKKAKLCSRPKSGGDSKYLALYAMAVEKARLQQEKSAVDKRRKQLESHLEDLQQRQKMIVERVQSEEACPERSRRACPERSRRDGNRQEGEKPWGKKVPKPLRTMILDY